MTKKQKKLKSNYIETERDILASSIKKAESWCQEQKQMFDGVYVEPITLAVKAGYEEFGKEIENIAREVEGYKKKFDLDGCDPEKRAPTIYDCRDFNNMMLELCQHLLTTELELQKWEQTNSKNGV